MNYIEFTNNYIKQYKQSISGPWNIVVFGPGYNLESRWGSESHMSVESPREKEDICDFCERYKFSDDFRPVDLIIMSRVLEHIPQRQLDWYLYSISSIMDSSGKLVVVVPDMLACAKELEKEFDSKSPNHFRTQRLTYEILSESDDIWFRHATWTCWNSVKYYLELENLFSVTKRDHISIDTDIVPREILVEARRANGVRQEL